MILSRNSGAQEIETQATHRSDGNVTFTFDFGADKFSETFDRPVDLEVYVGKLNRVICTFMVRY